MSSRSGSGFQDMNKLHFAALILSIALACPAVAEDEPAGAASPSPAKAASPAPEPSVQASPASTAASASPGPATPRVREPVLTRIDRLGLRPSRTRTKEPTRHHRDLASVPATPRHVGVTDRIDGNVNGAACVVPRNWVDHSGVHPASERA